MPTLHVSRFRTMATDTIKILYSGSFMSAHVLLNLLNEFGKRDKMRGLPIIFQYYIKITLKSHFCHKSKCFNFVIMYATLFWMLTFPENL